MDDVELIEKLKEYLEKKHKLDIVSKNKILIINFKELTAYDPDFGDSIDTKPDDFLTCARLAAEELYQFDKPTPISIRLSNLTNGYRFKIKDLRSTEINKLISIEGVIRQISEVRPKTIKTTFSCPFCGQVHIVPQTEKKIKEPICVCGRKGKFTLLNKEYVDIQKMVVEEALDNLDGNEQPRRLNILLEKDLCSINFTRINTPGNRVIVNGTLKEAPIALKTGGQSVESDLYLFANYIEPVEQEFEEIKISAQDIEEIKEFSQRPDLCPRLIEAVAPDIFGHEKIKEAILYQLFGGIKVEDERGKTSRIGDIHILLMTDPGAGKTKLAKSVVNISPKARYVDATGVSKAGLTATVIKDEFIGGWAVEAGAFVLANKGLIVVDEFDKMSPEDVQSLHIVLSEQIVVKDMANQHVTMRAETACLALANPKYSQFDMYETLSEQINLPSSLINRFDLVFLFQDVPDPTRDENIMKSILRVHKKEKSSNIVTKEFLRKYISYARKNCFPVITEEVDQQLINFYKGVRNRASKGNGGSKKSSVPITARQGESVIKLAEAAARMRLSNTISVEDVDRATAILLHCLEKIALDPETGELDILRLEGKVTYSQRAKNVEIKRWFQENAKDYPQEMVGMQDVINAFAGKMDASEIEQVLDSLKKVGDIYEPRPGVFALLR